MSRRRLIGVSSGLVAALLAWFLAVDWCWYEEDCLDCQLNRSIRQVRLARIVLIERTQERPTLLSMVADDLGVPCRHDRANRWLAERRLGLLLPVQRDPVLHAAQRPWYPPCARAEARSLAADHPDFAARFHSRILRAHDWAEWARLRSRLFDACPPDQRPEVSRSPGGAGRREGT